MRLGVEGGSMKLLTLALALLLAACSPSAPAATSGPTASSRVASPSAAAEATPSPVVESPSWPPQPPRDERYLAIRELTLSEDGRRIELEFTGARAYSPDDPCSADYTATAAVVDGVLEVGVSLSRQPPASEGTACDAMGHFRNLEVDLDEPFSGTVWRDLTGYVHFLATPEGLVELTVLPDGWELRAERDVEDSPTGRWERTYSPDASLTDETKRLVLYQSFDGPVMVTGGDEQRSVPVSGQPATLYRWPPNGELVLVWRLGNDGLALVAYESDFTIDDLIALAESAAPSSSATGSTWGPLAVLPAQDGMDTLRAEGPVRITDTCVYLEAHGVVYLLFWHADQVTWNADSRTITFENFPLNGDGKVVTVGDGDQVVVGGSGGGEGEGESGAAFVSRMDWIAPPDPSCTLDPWWSVGAVEDESP
jgi:hypothetical protein